VIRSTTFWPRSTVRPVTATFALRREHLRDRTPDARVEPDTSATAFESHGRLLYRSHGVSY
jgi:hypothetical protein